MYYLQDEHTQEVSKSQQVLHMTSILSNDDVESVFKVIYHISASVCVNGTDFSLDCNFQFFGISWSRFVHSVL